MTDPQQITDQELAEIRAELETELCHADPVLYKDMARKLLAALDAAKAEIERLNEWADGFSDRQMEERRTGEAYQNELKARIAELQKAGAELSAIYYGTGGSLGTTREFQDRFGVPKVGEDQAPSTTERVEPWT